WTCRRPGQIIAGFWPSSGISIVKTASNHPARVGRPPAALGGLSRRTRLRRDRPVSLVKPVTVARRSVDQLTPVIGTDRHEQLAMAASKFASELGTRTVWNVSSTAVGGGVAEMLQVLLGYVTGAGIAARWMVIAGDAEFFSITKRLHNQIHGQAAGGPLT